VICFKVWLLRLGIVLFLLVLIPPPLIHAHSGPSTSLFKKAKDCQAKLLHSSKAMRYRDRWERCINLYHRFANAKGRHPSKEETYFHLAELYIGLAKYSGKTQDIKKAEQQAGKLKRKYPRSHYVKTIEKRLIKTQGNAINQHKKTAQVRLHKIRYWSYPDYTRIVFDLSRNVKHRQEKKLRPPRLLIDLLNTRLARNFDLKVISIKDGTLNRVKSVQQSPNTVRATLDLGREANYRIIQLSNPDRLVVDVFRTENIPPLVNSKRPKVQKIRRIMIDPGHGGKDPGAVGRKGLTEKEVVLDVGLRLKDLIKKQLRKEVLMTRNRDVSIPLKKRTQLANEKQADLFISIHANAAPSRKIRGIEIFTLGQASDSSALATAARENSIREESLKNLDGAIKAMLADLSITKRLDRSLEFADTTRQAFVRTLGPKYKIFDHGVKQAPFYVLMNAGMPSILAEISFISNPTEEKRLATRTYRKKIAQSLFEGVQQYIRNQDRSAKVHSVKTSR